MSARPDPEAVKAAIDAARDRLRRESKPEVAAHAGQQLSIQDVLHAVEHEDDER